MTTLSSQSVLVAAASRHGSTAEIASFIAARLRGSLPSTWHVRVEDTDAIRTIEGYDAVVLGSAVYFGRWLKSARALVSNTEVAPSSGLWLFSSGPVDGPGATGDAAAAEKVAGRLQARDSIVFPGRIDASRLRRSERVLVKAMHIDDGDFRDWDVVTEWADMIAVELLNTTTVQHPIAVPASEK